MSGIVEADDFDASSRCDPLIWACRKKGEL
jgi:hypothetical protein